MWTQTQQPLPGARGTQVALQHHGQPATFGEVLAAWAGDAAFRAWFTRGLAELPYAAFKWETPALTVETLKQPFAYVALDSPGLARRVDPLAFARFFAGASADSVVSFTNLGGDATLVVPVPAGPTAHHGHLAAFVRGAPEAQQHALWQGVASAMMRRLGSRPVWLSTAGAGVSWLHVRLDDRPKYYGHAPFRRAP